MDYYTAKKQAWIDISTITQNNKSVSVDFLIYKLETKYGFGKKLVISRLEQLEKMNIIEFSKDRKTVSEIKIIKTEENQGGV